MLDTWWVKVNAVVHNPNHNTLEDGVKKSGYWVYYEVRNQWGLPEHHGNRLLLALDPLEMFTKFRQQMQKRWSVEPNNVRWENAIWDK